MRYKEFNVNRVLEKCLNLFWEYGYENSSIHRIVEATGVNRFSLYNEFENKQGILHATLQHYYKTRVLHRVECLNHAGEPKSKILFFFNQYLLENGDNIPGCFILHLSSEMADKSDFVKKQLGGYLNTIEKAFENALAQEVENPKFLARHLTGQFCTAMCFCLILSEQERKAMVANGVNIVLSKSISYA